MNISSNQNSLCVCVYWLTSISCTIATEHKSHVINGINKANEASNHHGVHEVKDKFAMFQNPIIIATTQKWFKIFTLEDETLEDVL